MSLVMIILVVFLFVVWAAGVAFFLPLTVDFSNITKREIFVFVLVLIWPITACVLACKNLIIFWKTSSPSNDKEKDL